MPQTVSRQTLGSLHTWLNESWCETQHLTWVNIPLQEQPTDNQRQIHWSHRPHRQHTNRQDKCYKRPTDQGNTLDQHTIHHNTPRPQLHFNWHHNPNTMKKSTKETHNTTQHNTTHTRSHLHKHHPQKSTLPQQPARHQQYLTHQIHLTDN